MGLGVLLKGFNSIYFLTPLDFIFEFLPQLAFISSILGYLVCKIFQSWVLPPDIQAYCLV